MDKFVAMQVYTRVVEAGNFTKAADSLNLPKPTVTRLIQSLETQLETRLLNRTTRRVTVTPDGAAYYDRALRVLADVEELESSMSKAKVSPKGRLRVDVGSTVGQRLLIPALPDFYARYPDIQIDLGMSDRPVDLIGENVDCVLRGGDLTDQSLVARRIGEFHLVLCATPQYLQRHGLPLHPLELEETRHRVIKHFSARTGRNYPFVFTNARGERHEIEGHHALSMNDSSGILTAALNGLGIARTSSFLAREYFEDGRLVPLMLDWCVESVPLYVVYPPNRHLSNKVRVFVDWVAELFARSDLIQQQCSLPKHGEQGECPLAVAARKAASSATSTALRNASQSAAAAG